MSQVKTIGQSGQLSLGKEYAGRTVVIDSPEEGIWVIKTAQVIPDNELWLHQEPAKSKLDTAIAEAESTPREVSNLDELEQKLITKFGEGD